MIELTAALEAAGATTKPKEKMAAIEGLGHESQDLLRLAQDPFITFGVKAMPEFTGLRDHDPREENIEPFFELADQLATRELTGNAAHEAIIEYLKPYSMETQETLLRVLKKDLRVNLGTTLINKVYPDLVPTFKVMLADKMDEKKFKWDAGPWLVEYKYDGMRIVAKVTEDTVECFSRKGLDQPKYNPVWREDLLHLRKFVGYDFWIDGEVVTDEDDFQATMKSRGSKASTDNLLFCVFDFISDEEWQKQKSKVPQLDRRLELDSILNAHGLERIVLSQGTICQTKEEVYEFYNGLVDAGAEGVIIKDPKAPYHWKRNKAWTKFKPVYTADLTLMGMYEGTGKYEGMLGGFQLEGELEDGTFVVSDCGSGFNDKDRKHFWKNQEKYLGQTIEVEYQEVTLAESKDVHALRFVVYKKVRTDK
jgi:ATP-dependent DNA ligase